ncbi:MAG: SURF4 family-domain-containing protein [Piptocephalis tieghemiana]|nr:MAG: SURF4 family-domain-containing protein [Piptocephalis tieghemiana]
MDQIKEYSSKVEDLLETYASPFKQYVPAFARFLLVVTFYEDVLRLIFQWSDQLSYLQRYQGMPWIISHLFILFNIIAMSVGATMAVAKKRTEVACGLLFLVVVSQVIGYGLLFEWHFFLRNLSIVGGLLMLLSDSLSRRRTLFAGLPSLNETDRSTYFQLAGRILLILLFISFIWTDEFSLARIVVSIIGFIACIMVVVGFKAKWSALFLILLLSIFNVLVNPWWTVHDSHPNRDFLKYDFFQILSIVGGLLLLVNMGPGGISVDEKKKQY